MIYWYWWPIVKDEQRTISAGIVNLLLFLRRLNNITWNRVESIWKKSIVVGSLSQNTKTDGSRLLLVPCMLVHTVRVRVRVQVLTICVWVQVQVPSTTALLNTTYTCPAWILCSDGVDKNIHQKAKPYEYPTLTCLHRCWAFEIQEASGRLLPCVPYKIGETVSHRIHTFGE